MTADYDRWALLKSNEPLIVNLQAHWRAILVRRKFIERLDYLKSHETEVIKLQAQWKGFTQRKAYQERLALLKGNVHVVVLVSGWSLGCCY